MKKQKFIGILSAALMMSLCIPMPVAAASKLPFLRGVARNSNELTDACDKGCNHEYEDKLGEEDANITVLSGEHTITFKNMKIGSDSGNAPSPLVIQGASKVTLKLEGDNVLTATPDNPAIRMSDTAELTICEAVEGKGASLTVTGGTSAAGISGGKLHIKEGVKLTVKGNGTGSGTNKNGIECNELSSELGKPLTLEGNVAPKTDKTNFHGIMKTKTKQGSYSYSVYGKAIWDKTDLTLESGEVINVQNGSSLIFPNGFSNNGRIEGGGTIVNYDMITTPLESIGNSVKLNVMVSREKDMEEHKENFFYDGPNSDLTKKAFVIKPTRTVKEGEGSRVLEVNTDGWRFKITPANDIGTELEKLVDAGDYHVWYVNDVFDLNAVTNSEIDLGKFTIKPKTLNSTDVAAKVSEQVTYTGKACEPSPRVEFRGNLQKGTDFRIIGYENNINATTTGNEAKIIIEGLNNYAGTREVKFDIARADINNAQVEAAIVDEMDKENTVYNGKGRMLKSSVKFGSEGNQVELPLDMGDGNGDYAITIPSKEKFDAGQAGVYKIVIEGKRNCKGTRTVDLTIQKKPVRVIEAVAQNKTYDGSPKVKITGVKLNQEDIIGGVVDKPEPPKEPDDGEDDKEPDNGEDTGEGDNTGGGEDIGEGDNTEGGEDAGEGDNTGGGEDAGEGDNTEGGEGTNEDNTPSEPSEVSRAVRGANGVDSLEVDLTDLYAEVSKADVGEYKKVSFDKTTGIPLKQGGDNDNYAVIVDGDVPLNPSVKIDIGQAAEIEGVTTQYDASAQYKDKFKCSVAVDSPQEGEAYEYAMAKEGPYQKSPEFDNIDPNDTHIFWVRAKGDGSNRLDGEPKSSEPVVFAPIEREIEETISLTYVLNEDKETFTLTISPIDNALYGEDVRYSFDGSKWSEDNKGNVKNDAKSGQSYKGYAKLIATPVYLESRPIETEATPILTSDVAVPTIKPEGGKFLGTQEVTIECETADAEIYYTLDGKAPTKESKKYEGPFTIDSSVVVKAIAVKEGMNDSKAASAAFNKANAGAKKAVLVEEGITTEGLSQAIVDAGYDTDEKVIAKLEAILTSMEGYIKGNIAYYDIVVQVSLDGVTWQPATEDDFPAKGVEVTVPYPEGTAMDTHDFTVVHMFGETSEKLGIKAGETEQPEVTKTPQGVKFFMKGMSPVAVAWKNVEADGNGSGDGNNPDGNNPDGNNPDGNNPDGNNPDGNNPDGNNPDGNNPDGNNPDGNNPDGNNPDGNNPDGNNPDGNNPDGNNPDGNNPDGNNPDGNNPDGNNPDGNKPDGNNPDGNKPNGNNPDGNKPDGNNQGGTGSGNGNNQGGGTGTGGNNAGSNVKGGTNSSTNNGTAVTPKPAASEADTPLATLKKLVNPKTGDSANPLFWLTLLDISLVAGAVMLFRDVKRR